MLRYFVALCILIFSVNAQKATVTFVAVNSNVTGTVTFTQVSNEVLIEGSVSGLSAGKHGFHVHALGDLSKGCTSTGGHFNPHNATHGAPSSKTRHVGDLGNIEADATGVAQIKFNDSIISLKGEHNIIGRAIVIHQDEDDLGLGGQNDSLTTGHAGARVACGIIGTLSEINSGHLTIPSAIFVSAMIILLSSTGLI